LPLADELAELPLAVELADAPPLAAEALLLAAEALPLAAEALPLAAETLPVALVELEFTVADGRPEDWTTPSAERVGVATGMLAALHAFAHWASTAFAVVATSVELTTPARHERHGLSVEPTLSLQRQLRSRAQVLSNCCVNAEHVL